MKTILVTGGAGFIGSHLCRKLLSNGRRIICVDNLFSGRMENIKDLVGRNNFTFIKGDIVKRLRIKGRIDEIYNLACIASPVGYQSKPLETLLVSSVGVKNLLDLAVKHGSKFLQTSTSEVYGDPLAHPQKETYWGNVNPIGIRSCYDEGKRFAESLIFVYKRLYGLDTKVVRIFNTYLELAKVIIKLTKSGSKIIHKGLPADDPTKRKPDITLAKERLAWSPKISLEEGLKSSLPYFKRTISK